MTELESLQQLFKDVKDTDYIVKRVLEYKSVFQVCINCRYFDEHSDVCIQEDISFDNSGYLCVDKDFGCNRFERKEDA